jgi:lipoprotein-anchoring transpeptidase ErfK/SrfK
VSQRWLASGVLAVALGGALALSGCTVVTTSSAKGETIGTTSTPTLPPTPAKVTITPADAASDVSPQTRVRVTPVSGTLDSVVVKDGRGTQVDGTVTVQGGWVASRYLRPNATYTVTATAHGSDGTPVTTTSRFRTFKPAIDATYHLVYDGQTVGVGMPISIQFDSAVQTKAMRAEVQGLVTVTSVPAQDGSWGWLDNRQLMWRPKTFWKAGTKVTVNAPLAGVQTGDGKFVGADASGGFTVGASMVSTVNIKTHMMTVRRNGKVLRTIPVSTGRPGPTTETRSGIKVIIDKQPHITMDSATVGIPKGSPGYYLTKTDWDLRVTWTGEFLHSAPWSVGSQGYANVSHGCTNLSPSNALWMYQQSKVGDVVKFVGSTRVFKPTEGIGVWQYTWAQWQKQSALA